MVRSPPSLRERAGAAALTSLVVAGLGWALIAGLAVRTAWQPSAEMQLFLVAPPPPPPPIERPPPHPRRAAREGASAPPNQKSVATEAVAPKPIVPPIQLPPIATAPLPSVGADASSGAALVAGPGTGAGGEGHGTGSDRFGTGGGDGGTPARKIKDVRFRDLPEAIRETLWRETTDYTVYVSFLVLPSGRVSDCVVTHPSGYPALDAATCRGLVEHARFSPEIDAAGRRIARRFLGPYLWEARGVGPPEGDDH